jgi:hypothetical protein
MDVIKLQTRYIDIGLEGSVAVAGNCYRYISGEFTKTK